MLRDNVGPDAEIGLCGETPLFVVYDLGFIQVVEELIELKANMSSIYHESMCHARHDLSHL